MKTFRDLKEGDFVEVFRYKKRIPCDIIIEGHHYVEEELDEDVIEKRRVFEFSHYNEENWKEGTLLWIQLESGSHIELPFEELDKTEYRTYKIIQDDDNNGI